MTSLFAHQFGYSPTYGLNGLATSEPEVGVTLPKSKPKVPTEKVPARVPANAAAATAGASAEAAKANSLSANASGGVSNPSTAGESSTNAAARQGTLSKLMHLSAASDAQTTATNVASNSGHVSAPNVPKYNGSDPNMGAVDSLGHWFAHTYDSVRHGTANVADKAGGLFAQSQGIPNQYSPHINNSNVPGFLSVPNYGGSQPSPGMLNWSQFTSRPGTSGAGHSMSPQSTYAQSAFSGPYSSHYEQSLGSGFENQLSHDANPGGLNWGSLFRQVGEDVGAEG